MGRLLRIGSIGCAGFVAIGVLIGIIGTALGKGIATPTPVNGMAAVQTVPKPSAVATMAPKIGSVVTGKNWQYVVADAERTPGNATFRPKGVWLGVTLILTNIAKENFPINDHDFELRDDGGIAYKTTSDFVAAVGYVESKRLSRLGERYPPSVPVSTAVLFDIAPSAKGLKLWLVQESVAIDLGQ